MTDEPTADQATTDDATRELPPETRDEMIKRKYYAGKAAQIARTLEQKALAKQRIAATKAKQEQERALKAQQDADYPKLTPQAWRAKYGSDKPKLGLIDHETAVKMISRRMTHIALHTLAHICEYSSNDSARVSAAREILDRGWGKAHLIAEGENRPTQEITVVFGNEQTLNQVNTTIDAEVDDADAA